MTLTLTLTLTQVYKKIEGQRVKVNFYLFFQVDQETVKTCLRLEEYGCTAATTTSRGSYSTSSRDRLSRGPSTRGGRGCTGSFLRAPRHFCVP